jgi:hypothetical protein
MADELVKPNSPERAKPSRTSYERDDSEDRGRVT